MVNFLLILEEVIKFSKKDIDKGLTPQQIYALCSCIREAFCLSYSIRKNNNLYIFFQKENLLLSFIGKELRYLGPDERSQALLLLKALNKGKNITPKVEVEMIQSTPGIYCTKFQGLISFVDYINKHISESVFFLVENDEIVKIKSLDINWVSKTGIIEDANLYIIPTYNILSQKSVFMNKFTQMKNINFLSLSKNKSIENKILYINFRKDHQETL